MTPESTILPMGSAALLLAQLVTFATIACAVAMPAQRRRGSLVVVVLGLGCLAAAGLIHPSENGED